MKSPYTCRIRFNGISVRFVFPGPVTLHPELCSFLCEDIGPYDAQYTVELLERPLSHPAQPVYVHRDTNIYQTEKGWLRIYSPLITGDGVQVACLLCPDGDHRLYYPAAMWDFFSSPLHCIHLIGIETVLLRRDAFLLHSSVVQHHGKAVLFSGDPCAGKSTQAALWQTHLGARILNGDRCVVRRCGGGFRGGGSPWAGTSGIYCPEDAPIAAIFLLRQAPENRVQRLGAAAFGPLFSQTIVNSWDHAFMERITELFSQLLSQVPVYLLHCRPDEGAVRAALEALGDI